MNIELHAPVTRIASFRFYEELNDFLTEEQYKTKFTYAFLGKPSIKDTIEAIGVPHTEIDLILIDGKSVGYDYHLQGGEQVSVYPAFESLDITPLTHLHPTPLRDTKFVVDVHLGKLAQKLRLLGFDALFENDFEDRKIVDLSLKEKRIILTQDRGILKTGRVTHGYWVRNKEPNKQLIEVINYLQLENNLRPFSRCVYCNALLHPIEKSDLRGRIPSDTLQIFDVFWECEKCRKIYWRGSHYERICQWIDEVKKQSHQ